ncbi:uncharacterized protein LOC133182476 [Saccostrea echinata]|uniref:uncharacterized protein LOC133182476 n=1 Tax=Saccostrea echinata TaxID=191078 RepID=UPI002A81969E|nr:uncharacterized protein LOC133182476 [Saccostrea echinata]
MDLRQRWLTLARDILRIQEDVCQKWWGYIEQKYSESQRHYHTLSHLEEMFQHFDQYHEKLDKPELVSLAIYFHDIIYDPKASDNEERSADVFTQFVKESSANLKEDERDKVRHWILLTKSHSVQERAEADLQYFLDMDMAVLGRTPEDYRKYAAQIRDEYSHYPDQDYRKGRSAVLKGFSQRQRIYASDEFHKLYHDIAVQNMTAEILTLQS